MASPNYLTNAADPALDLSDLHGSGTIPLVEGSNKRTMNEADKVLFVTQNSEPEYSCGQSTKRTKHNKSPQSPSSAYRLNLKSLNEKQCSPIQKVSKNCLPKLGPYHPSFKLAEAKIAEACDHFTNVYKDVKTENYMNEELEVVCDESDSGTFGLSHFRMPSNSYPPVRPVAVLGPAGSGKSSALNSLMGQKIAFAHDGQTRGTYVVHEYRSAHPKQTSRYYIEVPFLSRAEMRGAVMTHYKAIRSHLEHDEDDTGTETDERHSVDSYQTALGFFCDLFADHDEFQTRDEAEDFFQDVEYDSHEEVQGTPLSYLDKFLAARTEMADDKEIYTTDTEGGLDNIIRAVARSSNQQNPGRSPCPWPVIRKVVIHQKMALLEGGMILADLPGANDSDEIVAANTRSYLKQAGTILIFLHYQRVSKNSSLDQHLRHCISLGKQHQTSLVLTKIDNMQPFDDNAKVQLKEADRVRLMEAEDLVTMLERSVDETSRAKDMADIAEYRELDLSLRKLEQQLREAQLDVNRLTIDIRCNEIRDELKHRFRVLKQNKNEPDLPIIFISNTQQTGIPELRQEILKVPTLGKLDKLYALCTIRLRGIFSGIDGILTKSILERKSEVKAALAHQLNEIRVPVDATVGDIKSACKKEITDAIMASKQAWNIRAEKALANWERINAGTFVALCRRNGDWVHKKLGVLNCNLDVQTVFAPELPNAFNAFNDRVNGAQEDFKRNIHDSFDNIQQAVECCPAAAGQRLDQFTKHLDHIRQSTTHDIAKTFIRLQQSIERVRDSATIDAEGSFVRSAMSEIYQTSILINSYNHQTFLPGMNSVPKTKADAITSGTPKGKNKTMGRRRTTVGGSVHKTRIQNIRNKLRGEAEEKSFSQDIDELITDRMHAALEDWTEGPKKIMEQSRLDVLKDFDRRFRTPEAKAEESPEIVQRLRNAATESWRMVETAMNYLQECYAYEDKDLPY